MVEHVDLSSIDREMLESLVDSQ